MAASLGSSFPGDPGGDVRKGSLQDNKRGDEEVDVMVQREMEKPGLRAKVDCAFKQVVSISRLGANPEGERQSGIGIYTYSDN